MSQKIKIGKQKTILKAQANEKYVLVDETGKSPEKIKMIQKGKDLEIYLEDPKNPSVMQENPSVEIKDYYAPNMNAEIDGLDKNIEEAYVYSKDDGWYYLITDTAFGFMLTPLGLGVGAAGVAGVAVVAGSSDGNDTPSKSAQAPAVPTLSVSDSDNNGKINVSGVSEPGNTVTITWPDGTTSTVSPDPVSGAYSVESPTVQTNGNVTVKATDTAGNTSATSAPVTYTDTQAPVVPRLNVNDSDGDGKINVSGVSEPGSTVTITWPDGTTSTVATDPVSGAYSSESPTVQPSGEVKVKATDANGNVGAETTTPYIDTQAPVAPTLNVNDSDGNGKINVTGTAEPKSTVTITWPDGTTSTVATDPVSGAYSVESPTVQPSGEVKVKATDANGNVGAETTTPYIDTQAPVAPTLNVNDSDGNGKINVTGTAEPKSTVTITWPDGTTSTVATDPVSGAYSSESPTVQPSGEVKVKATDANGNVSGDMVALIIPTVNTITSTDNTPIITGTATLGSGETLSVTVNGATYDNVIVTAGTWSIDTSTAVVSSGTLGAFVDAQQYTVTAIVKDTSGNTATDISTNEVTIAIPTPPVLTSMQNLDGVTNLDVKSALVLSFDQSITLGSGHIKIYDDMGINGWNHVNTTTGESIRDTYDNDVDITLVNGVITAVTIAGVDYTSRFDLYNSVKTVGNDLVIDLKQAIASQAGGTGTGVSPYSIAFDWDFGSNYHVNFDAGIVKSSVNPSLTNSALSDSTTLNFTTVTPANDSLGALSQKMDETGVSTALSNSTYWVNGNQSANDGAYPIAVIDLAGKDVQVVLDTNGGASSTGNMQTYVQLNNFAIGDNLYLSNHGDMGMATTDGISASAWGGTDRAIGDSGSTGGTGEVWIYKDAGVTAIGASQDAHFESATKWGGTAYNAIIFG